MTGISFDSPNQDGQEATYRELRRIARVHMARSSACATLQPTALVHEAWLRMMGQRCKSRTHYLSLASRAMRHFLVDYLRSRKARKREGTQIRVPLEEGVPDSAQSRPDRAVDIERILGRLAEQDPRKSRVVELHILEGMEHSEIALVLNVSVITVKRDWQFCRAWLRSALE